LEDRSPSGTLNFSSIILPGDEGMSLTASDAGPSWYAVFAPSWLAEAFVASMAIFMIVTGPAAAASLTRNLRILHVNSIAQSMFCALFQLLLVRRLDGHHSSFWLIFSPWIASMGVQICLHFRKAPDARGRRSGFPIGVPHVLALVVVFKLEGAFNYAASSWANVLWPLWGAAGFFMLTVLFGVCCGLPLLFRREASVRCHLICTFGGLLLLVCSVVFPALLAAVRMTSWLDGNSHITAAGVLVPYLVAVSIVLALLCVSLVILSFSSALRARGFAPDSTSDDSEEGMAAGMADLFSVPAPSALVRESSTLFRRVSSSTMDKYERRLSGDPNAPSRGEPNESQADALLAGHHARSADESAIELIEVRVAPHQPAVSSPASAGSADILASTALTPPTVGTSGGGGGGGDGVGGEHVSDGVEGAGSAALEVQSADADGRLAEGGVGEAGSGGSSASASSGTPRRGTSLDGEDEGADDDDCCWICLSGAREAVLLECGHGGICYECAVRCSRRRPRQCPMCRQPITSIVRLAGPEQEVDGEVVVQVDAPQPRPTPSAGTTS